MDCGCINPVFVKYLWCYAVLAFGMGCCTCRRFSIINYYRDLIHCVRHNNTVSIGTFVSSTLTLIFPMTDAHGKYFLLLLLLLFFICTFQYQWRSERRRRLLYYLTFAWPWVWSFRWYCICFCKCGFGFNEYHWVLWFLEWIAVYVRWCPVNILPHETNSEYFVSRFQSVQLPWTLELSTMV